jgi:hypothetical protein
MNIPSSVSAPSTFKLEQLDGRAGQFVSASWSSNPTPAAAHKNAGVLLEKRTRAVVKTGIDFANLKEVKQGVASGERGEVQSLPWGEWAVFPYLIQHKGAEYFRLYPVENSKCEVEYRVNGENVTREVFKSYLTPSEQKKMDDGDAPITFTVKADSLVINAR